MDRKAIVKALGEHFGVKSKYLSVPTFNYEVRTATETYTIDRFGNITTREGQLMTLEDILNAPQEEVTEVAAPNETVNAVANEEGTEATENNELEETVEGAPEAIQEVTGLEIKLPLEGHTATGIINIINMLYSKQKLIMLSFKSNVSFMDATFAKDLSKESVETLEELNGVIKKLGEARCPGLAFNLEEETLTFKLDGIQMDDEKLNAFKDLCVLISDTAKKLKRASFKQAQDDNPKYAFRTWLIRIGMKGNEYKATRKTLLKNLEGSGAFRTVGEENHG
ncbi:hypothetical protein [Clostridium sp. DL1XJH146]